MVAGTPGLDSPSAPLARLRPFFQTPKRVDRTGYFSVSARTVRVIFLPLGVAAPAVCPPPTTIVTAITTSRPAIRLPQVTGGCSLTVGRVSTAAVVILGEGDKAPAQRSCRRSPKTSRSTWSKPEPPARA